MKRYDQCTWQQTMKKVDWQNLLYTFWHVHLVTLRNYIVKEESSQQPFMLKVGSPKTKAVAEQLNYLALFCVNQRLWKYFLLPNTWYVIYNKKIKCNISCLVLNAFTHHLQCISLTNLNTNQSQTAWAHSDNSVKEQPALLFGAGCNSTMFMCLRKAQRYITKGMTT